MQHPIFSSFRRSRCLPMLLGAALSLGMTACGQQGTATSGMEGTWAEGLPDPALEASADSRMWAAMPAGEGAEILRVHGETLAEGESEPRRVWRDSLGRPLELPSSLMHPIPVDDPAPGSLVTAWIAGEGLVVAQRVDGDSRRVRVDWNGETVEKEAGALWSFDAANPWLWVDGEGERAAMLALELARHEENVWILGPDGRVETVAEALTRPWRPQSEWQPGSAARLYSWADGIVDVEIVDAVEAGFRYRVRTADGGEDTACVDRLGPAS